MTLVTMDRITPREDSRAKRMKAATRLDHQRIDDRIMAASPFSSLENYSRFVRLQYRVHHAVSPLFESAALGKLLPDLAQRNRLELVRQDARDLGLSLPAPAESTGTPQDTATALGWLYVVEGSNLGAAFLLKAAAALGLSETHGARHLAGHPEGRGLHWRTFTTALDEVPLNASEEAAAIAGAQAAFRMVGEQIDLEFA